MRHRRDFPMIGESPLNPEAKLDRRRLSIRIPVDDGAGQTLPEGCRRRNRAGSNRIQPKRAPVSRSIAFRASSIASPTRFIERSPTGRNQYKAHLHCGWVVSGGCLPFGVTKTDLSLFRRAKHRARSVNTALRRCAPLCFAPSGDSPSARCCFGPVGTKGVPQPRAARGFDTPAARRTKGRTCMRTDFEGSSGRRSHKLHLPTRLSREANIIANPIRVPAFRRGPPVSARQLVWSGVIPKFCSRGCSQREANGGQPVKKSAISEQFIRNR
jgi:hypothetical protein